MSNSAYFRFGTNQGGTLVCCPCEPKKGVCLGGTPTIEIGNNLPQTKTIRFGGDGIDNGNPCGTTSGRCQNLFQVPIVVDLNTKPAAATGYANNCHFGYEFPVQDADCLDDNPDQSQRGGYVLYLQESGGGNPPTTARWKLDIWETDSGPQGLRKYLVQTYESADIPVPVDMTAWNGALNGVYDNSGLFGAPPGEACHYQNVTAEILA